MRNLLRDPDNRPVIAAKRRAARVLTSPAVGRVAGRIFRQRIPSAGVRVDTRSPAIADSSRAQLLWRIYEGAEHRLVRKHLRPTGTLVELGTSIGFLSSVALRQAGPDVRYIGVEANPELLLLAGRNIRANAPSADVTLVHGAVDYMTEQGSDVAFTVGAKHTGAARSDHSPSPAAFTAPAMTLSGLLESHSVTDFTLLADIEGAEAGMLLEDVGALQGCHQAVIELHQTEFRGHVLQVADLRQAALAAGFEIVDSYGPVVVLTR